MAAAATAEERARSAQERAALLERTAAELETRIRFLLAAAGATAAPSSGPGGVLSSPEEGDA